MAYIAGVLIIMFVLMIGGALLQVLSLWFTITERVGCSMEYKEG